MKKYPSSIEVTEDESQGVKTFYNVQGDLYNTSHAEIELLDHYTLIKNSKEEKYLNKVPAIKRTWIYAKYTGKNFSILEDTKEEIIKNNDNTNLYVIKIINEDIIKIGISKNIKSRVNTISKNLWKEVEILLEINNIPPKLEKLLHKHFLNDLYRGREWFNLSSELSLFINDPTPLVNKCLESL